MTLLNATDYEAVFTTPENDTYRIPLICWREDKDQIYGMILIKGQPHRADQIRHFLRYDTRTTTRPHHT
ncbi:hypothetical protein BJP40_13180, partial [Streptomyces sp. CC53]|uniref:DUF6253 family protein n=1 Tax=Streptomyces sp. CC53 TaxID=1906740 RepID=UPI0008DD7417